MKNIVSLFLAIFLLTSCAEKKWEKSDDGVIIHTKGKTGEHTRLIKIEPVSNRIFHVIASPQRSFSKDRSLCVYEQPGPRPAFVVNENGDYLIIATPEIKASVSLITGAVAFTDKNDKIILRESRKRREIL